MAKKVLIVEDDVSMLNLLAHKIGKAGFEVLTAQDGQAGLDLALKELPDLVLLDLLLPKQTGLNVLDSLRKNDKTAQIPVFILTNLSATSTIYKSIVLRADAFFIKSDTSLEHIVSEVKDKLG